jgi:hypothetical protein
MDSPTKFKRINRPPSDLGRVAIMNKQPFESLIWTIGSNAIIEKAVQCPCKEGGGENSTLCQNCLGSGWLFVNPVKTMVLAHGIRQEERLQMFGKDAETVMKFTVSDRDRVATMDRITMTDAIVTHSEILQMPFRKDGQWAYLDYVPKRITEIYAFEGNSKKLAKILPSDYELNGNRISFKEFTKHESVSIRYEHNPQYNAIYGHREAMVHPKYNNGTLKTTKLQFPVHFYGQKSNYVLDYSKYGKGYIINNSDEQ